MLVLRMNLVGARSRTCQIIERGTRPRVFKSYLIGKTEIAISGATDLQIGPSKRQNNRIDEYYAIMKQYFRFDSFTGAELSKQWADLLLFLRDVRCSKGDNLSSRSRNLEVEDFLERSFSLVHDFLSFRKV